MALDALRAALPAYARDMARNLEVLEGETVLTPQQKWGTLLASAYAVGGGTVIKAIEAEADLTPEAREAAKAAAAVMGMNNVWYPFVEMADDAELKTQAAQLRMNAYATNGGVDKRRFEMYALAASIESNVRYTSPASDLRRMHASTLPEARVL